jgi:3-methyladenine DNA glycosylase AlkD
MIQEEKLERFNDHLAGILDATKFDELISAIHEAVLLAENEDSPNSEGNQSIFGAIDEIRKRVRKEMDAISNTMTSEQADKVMELWATLTRIIRREKKVIAARKEFDAMLTGKCQPN